MLKFKNDRGELKFVLRDGDTEPVAIEDIADDILEELGLKEKGIEKIKDKLKPQGLSNDGDVKFIKGD